MSSQNVPFYIKQLVKFILETVRDIGNPLTYYKKLSTRSIKNTNIE
jgi:hypothetical protein